MLHAVGTTTNGPDTTLGSTMGGGVCTAGSGGPIGTLATVVVGSGTGTGSVGGAALTAAPQAEAMSTPMKTERTCFTPPRY
jgi:hypothetical protein